MPSRQVAGVILGFWTSFFRDYLPIADMAVMLIAMAGLLGSIVSLAGRISWLRERGFGEGYFPEATTIGRTAFYSLMG